MMRFDQLSGGQITAEDRVPKQTHERLVTYDVMRAIDRIPQSALLRLIDKADLNALDQLIDRFQQMCLAAAAEPFFQNRIRLEVLLERSLLIGCDQDDIADSRVRSLLHDILNRGPI